METTIMHSGCMVDGKQSENYYNGLYRDYYKDPFVHS